VQFPATLAGYGSGDATFKNLKF